MGIEQYLSNLRKTFNYQPKLYDFYDKLASGIDQVIHNSKTLNREGRSIDQLVIQNGRKLVDNGIKTLLIDFNSLLYRAIEEVKTSLKFDANSSADFKTQLESIYEIIFKHLFDEMLVGEIIKYFSKAGERLDEHPSKWTLTRIGLFIDGIPTRAKMIEQKRRKYLSVIEEMIDDILKTQEQTTTIKFNKNLISTGTHFMDKLYEYLTNRTSEFGDLFYISPHTEPGEGEHKIREYIETHYKTLEKKICIYSPDGDVTLTTLLYNDLYVFRSTQIFDTDRSNYPNYYTDNIKYSNELYNIEEINKSIINHVINVSNIDDENENKNFSEYISHFRINVIFDIVFIFFLLGNDFIAKQSLYNATKMKIIVIKYKQFLIRNYRKKTPFIIKYTGRYEIDPGNFKSFIDLLADTESHQYSVRKWFFNNSTIIKLLELSDQLITDQDAKKYPTLSNIKDTIIEWKNLVTSSKSIDKYPSSDKFCKLMKTLIDDYSELKMDSTQKKIFDKLKSHFLHFEIKDLSCDFSELLPYPLIEKSMITKDANQYVKNYRNFEQFKIDYYKQNFGIDDQESLDTRKNDMMKKYTEGILWTFEYYFNLNPTNKCWSYPYNIAPFLSDIKDVILLNLENAKIVLQPKDVFQNDRTKQFIYTHPIQHYFKSNDKNNMIYDELRIKPEILIMLHIVLLKYLKQHQSYVMPLDIHKKYSNVINDKSSTSSILGSDNVDLTLKLLSSVYKNMENYNNNSFDFLFDQAISLFVENDIPIFPKIELQLDQITHSSIRSVINCWNASHFGKCHFVFDYANDDVLFELLNNEPIGAILSSSSSSTPYVHFAPSAPFASYPQFAPSTSFVPSEPSEPSKPSKPVPSLFASATAKSSNKYQKKQSDITRPTSSQPVKQPVPQPVPKRNYDYSCLTPIPNTSNSYSIPNKSHLIRLLDTNNNGQYIYGILCPSGMYWILHSYGFDKPLWIQDSYNNQNIIPPNSQLIPDGSILIQGEVGVYYLKISQQQYFQIDQNGLGGPYPIPQYRSGLMGGSSVEKSNDYYYYKFLKYMTKYRSLVNKMSS